MANQKLNITQPYATVIGHDVPGVVFMQGKGYYNAEGKLLAEEVDLAPDEPVIEETTQKGSKKSAAASEKNKVKDDVLARATSILGDLGSAPATDPQQKAVKENAIAENAESLADT